LNEGAIAGLTIQTTDDAQIDYLFDLRGPLSWTFKDLRIENKWTGGGGFRSRAILTDPTTWLNRMYNVEIRVNDASTKYAFDVDWSDSAAIGCVFTGGLGSIYRGPGNMEFIGDQFDRATSSGAGLCLSKELASNGQINVAACSFDANVGPGLKFTAQSSPSGTVYSPTITGCGFRNPSATDDIVFDSTSISSVMSGPVITGCAFSQSGVVPWSLDESKWLVAFGLNYYANTSWTSTIFGDTRAQTTVIGKNGINIAGGSAIIRNSQTLRGAPNAAMGVGVNTDASPLTVFGVKDGTTPYVGASQDNASTFADLGILLSGVIKARFTAAGTAFRPESDLTMALGANTLRWTSVYAQNMGITNGATAPTAQTGVARIYIDSAGGAPKIIYPDGTIKTFTVT
jgi:hypothetical protein